MRPQAKKSGVLPRRSPQRRSRLRTLLFEGLENRRLLSASPSGNEFQLNTTTAGPQFSDSFYGSQAIATDADGDFVVAWRSFDGSGYGIYAQRYNAVGARQGLSLIHI